MEKQFTRPKLLRPYPGYGHYPEEELGKPNLQKVIRDANVFGFEPDWNGDLVPKNRVRIRSARFNFDLEKVRESHKRDLEEANAVEENLAKEKYILREAFILRQRRKQEAEFFSRKF